MKSIEFRFGIWRNNTGYPDEEGIRRNERESEPIPGTYSYLAKSARDGSYLSVKAGKTFNREITWLIKQNNISDSVLTYSIFKRQLNQKTKSLQSG